MSKPLRPSATSAAVCIRRLLRSTGRQRGLALLLALASGAPLVAVAKTVAVASTQVGGFYADGTKDNFEGFQNYFVGYGTTPGFARTSERRSFFVFDLGAITGSITAATFSLTMPFEGVVGDEPSETFVLSASPVPAATVLATALPPPAAMMVFGSLGTGALVAPELGIDVGAPPYDMVLTMSLNEIGLAALNIRPPGGMVVLGGRMASWSFDPDPMHEPDELLFGHSDVVFFGTPIVAKPMLTMTVVPEPSAWLLMLSGLAALLSGRRSFGARRAA
jgi:hypothetical protein